jgi:hypothetical protein
MKDKKNNKGKEKEEKKANFVTIVVTENPQPQDSDAPLHFFFFSFLGLPLFCHFTNLRRMTLIRLRPSHAYRKGCQNIPSKSKRKQCFSTFYIATPAAPSETLSERLMRSCARQRFVAASSRRTEEKVASRKGSGRHWRKASRALLLSLRL